MVGYTEYVNLEQYTSLNPRAAAVDNLYKSGRQKTWMKAQKDTGHRQPSTHANDLNAAFYGADPAGVEIIYRKTGFPTRDKQAFQGLRKEIEALAHRFRWNGRPDATRTLTKRFKARLEGLIEIALFEIDYEIKCDTCNGTPERMVQLPESDKAEFVSCPTCRGRGIRRLKDKDKARYLGVSVTDYSRKWKYHLKDIQILLDTKEAKVSRSATAVYG